MDISQQEGDYPPLWPLDTSEILGVLSGTIHTLGLNVTGWKVGDKALGLAGGGGVLSMSLWISDLEVALDIQSWLTTLRWRFRTRTTFLQTSSILSSLGRRSMVPHSLTGTFKQGSISTLSDLSYICEAVRVGTRMQIFVKTLSPWQGRLWH
jgi:hypothetical protein